MYTLTQSGHYHGEDYGSILDKAESHEAIIELIKAKHLGPSSKIDKVVQLSDNVWEVSTLYDENCDCRDTCTCPEDGKDFVEDDMEWFIITKL